MVTRSVVQSAMHTAASALVHLPVEQWPGWVAYLCETLVAAARDQGIEVDADELLRKIADEIQSPSSEE
ncbi:MAG: hypothetical protein JW981_03415 [Anaerolineae bacterium]|nr:hypothetical protein [Anaerolineae bacterium]